MICGFIESRVKSCILIISESEVKKETRQIMADSKRQLQWDLLRSISMFMVVVVHSSSYLPQISNHFDLQYAMSQAAIVCDPVFFMLSGYFALRPLKCSLKEFYLKKVSSILFPIFLYSVALYL